MDQPTRKIEVEQILLMPIICEKKKDGIFRKGDRIYTGQKYYSTIDEDMTDFAVGFYNIVYGNILTSKELLDEKGYLYNCNFAGDTMNSFNAIANIVPDAGKSAKQRTEEEKWPDFLREYHSKYHCLANFWLLPMCIGRRSAKLNRYDSVGIFMNILKDDYGILETHRDYFKQMDNYCDFCEKHYITDYNLYDIQGIREKYVEGKAEYLIEQAYQCMKSRAASISADNDICENLYHYFEKLGLIL